MNNIETEEGKMQSADKIVGRVIKCRAHFATSSSRQINSVAVRAQAQARKRTLSALLARLLTA